MGNETTKQRYNPQQAKLHFKRGLQLKNENRLHEAYVEMRKVVEFHPRDRERDRQFCLLLSKLGKNKEKKLFTSELLKQHPQDYHLNLWYCESLVQLQEFIKAQQILKKLLGKYSDISHRKPLLSQLVKCLLRTNKYNEAHHSIKELIKIQPKNAYVRYQYALILQQLKRSDDALIQYETSLRLKADNHVAMREYCRLLNQMKKFDTAVKICESYINFKPNSVTRYNLFGNVLFYQKSYIRALEMYKMAVEINNDKFSVYVSNYLSTLQALNRSQEAREEIEKYGNTHDIDDHSYYYHYAKILCKLNAFSEAKENFIKCIELQPNNDKYLFDYIKLLTETREYIEAEKLCKNLILLKANIANYWNQYGLIFFHQAQYEKSLSPFKKSIELYKNCYPEKQHFYTVYVGNYLSSLMKVNQTQEALKEIEYYLPNNPINRNNNKLYFKYIEILIAIRKFDKAEKICKKLIASNQDVARYHNMLGNIYNQQTHNEKALNSYKIAKALGNTKFFSVYAANCVLSLIKLKRYQEAMNDMESYTDFSLNEGLYYYRYGLLYDKMYDLNESEKYYKKCLVLHYEYLQCGCKLISLFNKTKRYQESVYLCEELKQRYPKNINVMMIYSETLSLMGDTKAVQKMLVMVKSVQIDPNDISALATYAVKLLLNESFSESEECFEKLYQMNVAGSQSCYFATLVRNGKWDKLKILCENDLVKDPQNGTIHYFIAMFYCWKNQWSMAAAHAMKSLELLKHKPTNITYSICLARYAKILMQMNQINDAKKLLQPLLEQEGIIPIVVMSYASLLKKEGNYESAKMYYKQAEQLIPNSKLPKLQTVILKSGYGHLHYLLKQYEESKKYIEHAIKMKMGVVLTHFYYALLLYDLNELYRSEQEFMHCIKKNPFYAEFHYEFGIRLSGKFNRQHKAMEHIQKAVQIDPLNKKYAETLNAYVHQNMIKKESEQKYDNDNVDGMILDSNQPFDNYVIDDFFMVSNLCAQEFERFLTTKLGEISKTYLKVFVKNGLNDIRNIRYYDNEDTLENIIVMNKKDKHEFLEAINEYKQDFTEFGDWLKSLNMFEKYHGLLENDAICSFWSFRYYIKTSFDLQKIITNKKHSKIIWNSFQSIKGQTNYM